MSDINKQLDSTKDKVSGKAKEIEGNLTGDKTRETEGKTQSLIGKAKDKLADTEDTIKGAIDEAKTKLKKNDN
ncbi:CsbD family protein [Lactiplantibacillus herbarum]|uniref:CsbD family protein n=1 Tax=Lactiplantibacillus herbarum TaxID=1670446 RepID=UPI00064EC39F|nr:CsbD family protein [Lactiplantibacillus herbarum]